MDHAAIQLLRSTSSVNKDQNYQLTSCDDAVETLRPTLLNLSLPVVVEVADDHLTVSNSERSTDRKFIASAPAYLPEFLGDNSFRSTYGTRYALYAGSMANGISSEELVIAMGKAGMMGSFGAGGLLSERIEKAIQIIRSALPDGPYAFNLINSPSEPALEEKTAELYIRHDIKVVEASAYLGLTANLVWYRASGLSKDSDGNVIISHHIIAKVSRKEIAKRFLEPASEEVLQQLVQSEKDIT